MELIKKNIHMDHIKTEAVNQLILEDDVNIPESKPDVDRVHMEKGEILIEEVKAGADVVNIRGRLIFTILYGTSEREGCLAVLEGRIPFEERMNMQGSSPQDNVAVNGKIEDLHIDIINSRKLSIQSVVTLHARIEEICDTEVPVAIHGAEPVEYRRMPVDTIQLVISKNDIFRVKEEIVLPSGYPNILQLLWHNVSFRDVEFKALNEKISVRGDVHIFVLYEGEGENHPLRTYEIMLPLNGQLECHGCREGMMPDIRYILNQQEFTARPDFDGEERCIGMELVLDIFMKVYEETPVEIISDIYGVNKEVEAVTGKAQLRKLLTHMTGKTKVADQARVTGEIPVLQLLHSEGQVILDHCDTIENGILLQGSIAVRVMYITGDDKAPYVSTTVTLPYEYTMEVPGIQKEDLGEVHADVEQLQVNLLDSEELAVKAVLAFTTTVFRNMPIALIEQVKVSDIAGGKLSNLPGMVIYIVQSGDNLWNIGKKYYVPVKSLRERNALESDELKVGQKLLIVKGSC